MTGPSSKYAWLNSLVRHDLSGNELRVLIVVFDTHRDREGVAKVSVKDIVDRTGIARATVQRVLNRIEKAGAVSIARSRGGGGSKHEVRLLDPAGADFGRNRDDRDNCLTMREAVRTSGNCLTMGEAETASPTRARGSQTLTLGAAQAAPHQSVSGSTVEIRRDLSVSSATPKGASETENDDDDWCSSPAEEARRADLLAGRIAVDLPTTASETIDDDDCAHTWMSQVVNHAISGDGEAQIRREIDALVMAAVHEGDDRALDAEDWLLRTATAELTRRRAAGTGRVGDLPSNNSPLAAHLEEKARG